MNSMSVVPTLSRVTFAKSVTRTPFPSSSRHLSSSKRNALRLRFSLQNGKPPLLQPLHTCRMWRLRIAIVPVATAKNTDKNTPRSTMPKRVSGSNAIEPNHKNTIATPNVHLAVILNHLFCQYGCTNVGTKQANPTRTCPKQPARTVAIGWNTTAR